MTKTENTPPQTNTAPTVTRKDAIKFLEGACRNWSKVPRLSNDDLQDVATELSRFMASRPSPENPLKAEDGQ
jgi:hypothetical protein